MNLKTILESYPAPTLEKIASNQISDIIHLKLPPQALIQELCEILCSFSYISSALSFRQPPNFMMINLLLEQKHFSYDVISFKSKVLAETNTMVNKDFSKNVFKAKKNYELYIKILKSAWESESSIDRSEANILSLLRKELEISYQEHVILEHDPEIASFWNGPNVFENERNYLMSKGILLTYENNYIIAEEIVPLIKKLWDIEMDSDDYRRFLSYFSAQQLEMILKHFELPSSGDKETKINTLSLSQNSILPSSILNMLSVEELRSIARDSKSRVTGTKEELITGLLNHFDKNEDIRPIKVEDNKEIIVELKALAEKNFSILFNNLSNDELYDIANKLSGLYLSGTKQKRVDKFWLSHYSEKTLLSKIANESLRLLCIKFSIPKSGDKNQIIDRIIKKIIKGFDTVDEIILESNKIGKPVREKEANEIDIRKELPNLETVERDFGYLSPDERIVLSAIIDLKSLSEDDLVRLASRFDLNWVLTKACMSEMIEKLKQNSKDIINVRSMGDKNIYEYKVSI